MSHHTARRLAISGLLSLLGTVGVAAAPAASASSGADMAVSVTGPRTVRLGDDITYTIRGTNVGDQTATSVQLEGMVEDWFDWRSSDCGSGTASPDHRNACDYGEVAPGETVTMTLTMTACCQEHHMFQFVWVSSANDVNPDNNTATVKLNFRGPKR